MVFYSWSERLSEIDGAKMLYLFAHAPDELAPVGWLRLDVDDTAGYIASLFVVEGHRNASVGTVLVSRAMKACKERGMETLGLSVKDDNADARRLYTRLGFVQYLKGHEGYTQLIKML